MARFAVWNYKKKRKNPYIQQTKLLVIYFKRLFQYILKDVFPRQRKVVRARLVEVLRKFTNIGALRKCLRNSTFKQVLQRKIESGEMLKYMMQMNTHYRNMARILKYLNRLINAAYCPSKMQIGIWTQKAITIRERQPPQDNP